jgi:hypothetical protein
MKCCLIRQKAGTSSRTGVQGCILWHNQLLR